MALSLVGAAAAGGLRLGVTNDHRVFCSADSRQLQAYEATQATHTKKRQHPLGPGSRRRRRVLAPDVGGGRRADRRGLKIPFAIRVDAVTNFQHTRANGDDLVVEDLVHDPATIGDAQLVEARRVALAEPNIVNRLRAPTADVTGVNVAIQLPGEDSFEQTRAVAAARDLLEHRAASVELRFQRRHGAHDGLRDRTRTGSGLFARLGAGRPAPCRAPHRPKGDRQ